MTSALRERLVAWNARYPDPAAPADENLARRAEEDAKLAKFAGLDVLTPGQAKELVEWKFQSMPHRKVRALQGISSARWKDSKGTRGAGQIIRRALAAEDDSDALSLMAAPAGGVYGFGPAMGSAILAACRPSRFTVADARALEALRALDLMPPGPPTFRLGDWQPYLETCRELSRSCRMSLRNVDRALWVAGADPARSNPGSRHD